MIIGGYAIFVKIFQQYSKCLLYWQRKPEYTDLPQVNDKFDHLKSLDAIRVCNWLMKKLSSSSINLTVMQIMQE